MSLRFLTNEQCYEGYSQQAPRRVTQIPRQVYETALVAFGDKASQIDYWLDRAKLYHLQVWLAGNIPRGYWTIRKGRGGFFLVQVITNGQPFEADAYQESLRHSGEHYRDYADAAKALIRQQSGERSA